MIISGKEVPKNKDDKDLRPEILIIGGNEIGFWKRAVIADKSLFNQLYGFINSDDHRVAWRSCWIIDNASEDCPELLADKLTEIIEALISTNDGSLKRHFTRILCRYTIPEDYLVVLVNRCFELLLPSEPAAVRVFAMQILFNITRQLPDIKGELVSVIESLRDEGGSAGFINRSEKLLRKLHS